MEGHRPAQTPPARRKRPPDGPHDLLGRQLGCDEPQKNARYSKDPQPAHAIGLSPRCTSPHHFRFEASGTRLTTMAPRAADRQDGLHKEREQCPARRLDCRGSTKDAAAGYPRDLRMSTRILQSQVGGTWLWAGQHPVVCLWQVAHPYKESAMDTKDAGSGTSVA